MCCLLCSELRLALALPLLPLDDGHRLWDEGDATALAGLPGVQFSVVVEVVASVELVLAAEFAAVVVAFTQTMRALHMSSQVFLTTKALETVWEIARIETPGRNSCHEVIGLLLALLVQHLFHVVLGDGGLFPPAQHVCGVEVGCLVAEGAGEAF